MNPKTQILILKTRLVRTLVALAVISFVPPLPAADLSWTGFGGNDLWSTAGDPGNWSPVSTSPAGNSIIFTNTDAVGAGAPVNNIVDANYTVNSLAYTQSGSALWHKTRIDEGVTLTLQGASAIFTVGVGLVGNNNPTQVAISGPGTLAIDQAGGIVQIGGGLVAGGANVGNGGFLDMSGLARFDAKLGATGIFRVGSISGYSEGTYTSTVKLAQDSRIAAGTLSVGGETGQQNTTQTFKLGSVSNTLRVNTINVGTAPSSLNRSSGEISFETGAGAVEIRNFAGTGGAEMNLVWTSSATAAALTGTVNLLGHQTDVVLSNLNMAARSSGPPNNAVNTATFSFDAGSLEIATVNMGYLASTTNANANLTATLNLGSTGSTGTSTIGTLRLATNRGPNNATSEVKSILNVAGGSHTVGNIAGNYGGFASTGKTTSTINLTGGTLTVDGSITRSTGAGANTLTLNLRGGALDLTDGAIGDSTNPVSLIAESGTLRNVASLNGTGGLTKTTAGTLTVEGTNTWTGATLVSGGTLVISGSTAAGSAVTVNDGATLSGNGTVGGTVTVNAGGTLSGESTLNGAAIISGTHSPGNSPGIQTFAAGLSYTSGAELVWELAGNTDVGRGLDFDGINVTGGDLNIADGVTATLVFTGVNFADAFWSAPRSWLVLEVGNGTTLAANAAIFSTIQLQGGTPPSGSSFSFSQDGNNIYLRYGVIPEPSAAGLLAAGLMAVFFLRRRARN